MQAQTSMPSSRAYSMTSVPRSSRSKRDPMVRANDMMSSPDFLFGRVAALVAKERTDRSRAVPILYHVHNLRLEMQGNSTSAYSFAAIGYAAPDEEAIYPGDSERRNL
jgi:hypothetical protein